MQNLLKLIGSRVREFRKKRGFTQELLAHKAGLHTTFIAHIELGNKVCSVKSLQKLARALSISVGELLCMPQTSPDKHYDTHTEKLISLIKDKTDKDKELLLSVANSLFKRTK